MRLDMGFTTELDVDDVRDELEGSEDVDMDANNSHRAKKTGGVIPVSEEDKMDVSVSSTTTTLPLASDFRIPATPSAEVISRAPIEEPSRSMKVVEADAVPGSVDQVADAEDVPAALPTVDPSHATSNGAAKSTTRDAEAGHVVPTQSKKEVPPRQSEPSTSMGQGQDDDDEPLPELDSDMDLSDEGDDIEDESMEDGDEEE